MGQVIVTGATCTCSFGAAPGSVTITSQTAVLVDGKPAGTISDSSKTNVTPFGMCSSLANPMVAAATAAALGVLTPQPCNFMPAGTWIPAKPTVLVGGKPVLTSDSKLMCAMGMGLITIGSPGQAKVMV